MVKFTVKSNKQQVDAALEHAIAQMLTTWGITAQGFATNYVPVDTGRLHDSIIYETDVDRGLTVIGTNVEYAIIVETNDKASHEVGKAHYMRDAVANHTDLYNSIAAQILGKL